MPPVSLNAKTISLGGTILFLFGWLQVFTLLKRDKPLFFEVVNTSIPPMRLVEVPFPIDGHEM